MIAVPLLALSIPLEVAAPLAVLVSITVAAIVVVQDWKKIHLHTTAWLVVPTLFGIPLGLLLLTSRHQRFDKAALGIVIVAFSIYSLIGRAPLELKRDSKPWLLLCGFFAGVDEAEVDVFQKSVAAHAVVDNSSQKDAQQGDWKREQVVVGDGGNPEPGQPVAGHADEAGGKKISLQSGAEMLRGPAAHGSVNYQRRTVHSVRAAEILLTRMPRSAMLPPCF